MILIRAPLRVSLLGGGSDYPAHFIKHGGAVLGMAIDKYVYVGVKQMPPGQLLSGAPLKFRVQYSKVDDCQTADEIKHPAVRAAVKYFGLESESIEFHIFGDLPGRSGLGGSSSFVVALLHALMLFKNPSAKVDKMVLAREAIAFEQFIVNEAVGCQDQLFAALGGVRYVEFDRDASEVSEISLLATQERDLEDSLVLVFTGGMRDGHVIAGEQIMQAPERFTEFDALRRLAGDGRDVLTIGRPTHEIGALLDVSWSMKRKLADVTNPEIDALHARGKSLGAIGGKLLGAGGGGFMLFYVPEYRGTFIQKIGMPCVTFKIADRGSTVIIND